MVFPSRMIADDLHEKVKSEDLPKKRKIMGFIQLIVYALLGENIKVLDSHQVFDERFSLQAFFTRMNRHPIRRRFQMPRAEGKGLRPW